MDTASALSDLKQKWARAILSGGEFSVGKHPLRSHPLVQGMDRKNETPVDLQGLNFKELCEFSVLRSSHDGGGLISHLASLSDFPTLFSSQESYDPLETKQALDLLKQLHEETSLFYQALSKIAVFSEEKVKSPLAKRVAFGDVKAAFTLQGKKVPYGALNVQRIEVPAFGPHLHPLNEASFFGVDLDQEFPQFARVSGDRELWFEHKLTPSGFEIQMFGVSPKKSVFFTFYVRAEKAVIKGKEILPKTLNRFSGEADSVMFKKQDTVFSINPTSLVKTTLIPLAGDASFWGSDFLLAFEIPVFDGRLGVQFT